MNRNVLIIEDDHDIANLVRLHLEDLGCRAEVESDGLRGYERTSSERFDLVILDLMLPTIDGFEICRRLLAEELEVEEVACEPLDVAGPEPEEEESDADALEGQDDASDARLLGWLRLVAAHRNEPEDQGDGTCDERPDDDDPELE